MISKTNHFISKALFYLTALTSGAFFCVVLAAALSRYLRTPFLSSVELSRLLFVWSCFFAATLAYAEKAHIALSFVMDKLPLKIQLIFETVAHFLSIAFFGLTFYFGFTATMDLWPTQLPTLKISQGWFYVPLMIVSPLMILIAWQFLLDLSENKEVL